MFQVQKKPCSTCIYRKDSPLDIDELENQIKEEYGEGFKTFRVCHHSDKACCNGFWTRHKNEFPLGQIAQRLQQVEFVQDDNQIPNRK